HLAFAHRLFCGFDRLDGYAELLAEPLGEFSPFVFIARIAADTFDGAHRANRLQLRLSLPPRPDDSRALGSPARQVFRRDAGRRARSHLPQPVRLDDGEIIAAGGIEQVKEKTDAATRRRICLESKIAPVKPTAGHDVKHPAFPANPLAWASLCLARPSVL